MSSEDPSRRDLMGLLAAAPVARGLADSAIPAAPSHPGVERLALSRFVGADPTGVTDSSAAIREAIDRAGKTGLPVHIDGVYRYAAPLAIPARVLLIGNGATSDAATRGHSCLLKDFDAEGPGILFAGADAGAERIHFDNVKGRAGDNVHLAGERQSLEFCAFTNAGRDGLWVGGDGSGKNANLWRLTSIACLENERHGLRIDSLARAPDANAGFLLGADLRGNGGDGIHHDGGWWNTFVNACCQDNKGAGFRLGPRSRGCLIVGGDVEGNRGSQGVIEGGAAGNKIDAPLYGSGAWTDLSPQGANRISAYSIGAGGFLDGDMLTVANSRAGGEAVLRFLVDAGLNQVGQIRARTVLGTGGGVSIWTKPNRNDPAEAVFFDEGQNALFRAGMAEKYEIVPYASRIAVWPRRYRWAQISVSDARAFTIALDTSGIIAGQRVSAIVRNMTAGLIAAGSWAGAKLSSPVRPAAGKSIAVHFVFDGHSWIEEARSAEVPL
ncbi:MAG: hypothetical protein JSS55_06525 [Proteobacteria bacterium]|nr:hypothetical protein [Pseudomonadota bacterium]